MADNVELNPGSGGESLATDEIGGIQHQRVKVGYGADGEYQDANAGDPLPVETLSPRPGIWQFADEVGDGSGNINAVGDYLASLTEFAIAPPAGKVFSIARMIVTVRDTGSFDSGSYGNGLTLVNGISVEKRTGVVNGASSLVQSLTDPVKIETNTDWGSYCYDIGVSNFGQGDEVMLVRWTFARAGVALRLDGDANEYLAVRLNDDFTGLVGHVFNMQGKSS